MNNKNSDWFCKCCKHLNRENPTILRDNSLDSICYSMTNMCCKCYEENNGGHKFDDILIDLEIKNKEQENAKV